MLLALVSAAAPALAASRCVKPCRTSTAACVRTRCADLAGAARRTCVETCRQLGGCARIRTLAYVVTECRSDAQGIVGRQELRVQRGSCAPVVVATAETGAPQPDPVRICRLFGRLRVGGGSRLAGVFQRLSVSRDGRLVAFEVSNDHVLFPIASVPPEEEGVYVVGSDGSELRRIGRASRVPSFKIYPAPTEFGIGVDYAGSSFGISPDRRTLVTLDLGPGPDGAEAIQLVTIDVATGRRAQVTRLPDATPSDPSEPATHNAGFLDNDTLVFRSYANPDGLNPEGDLRSFRIATDGTGLAVIPGPRPIAGGRVVADFSIAGGSKTLFNMRLPGVPENAVPTSFVSEISELFVLDGRRSLLQLTNFQRVDTVGGALSPDGRLAVFRASADPLRSNPTHNCQLFAVDTLGAGLRQLTSFRDGEERSVNGCGSGPPPGCHIGGGWWDSVTGSHVIVSTCDPFGAGHYGERVFALRHDGSGLRLLTDTRGFVTHADGSVTVEMPGPAQYVPNVPARLPVGR